MKFTKIKYQLAVYTVLASLLFAACSTEKNTALSRTYHNITAYYNVYFNGVEAYKAGLKKVDDGFDENYSIILPVFKYSDPEVTRVAFGDMNRAIEKGGKCIRKHSITVEPGTKKGKKKARSKKKKSKFDEDQPNYVKWIDDSYLLIGKANFYKHDFFPAIETFNYLVKEYRNYPIKYESYVWLSRIYCEMGKFPRAEEFLSLLDNDKDNIPEDMIGPWQITWADFMLKQEKYLESLPYLEKAIDNTKDKAEKVRYYYILAQIYEQLDDNSKAYDAYGKVIEMNPDYEMSFNARINRASIFNSNANDSKELVRELNKMLRDDKNIDYQDQIYYALGNIAFNESREDDAIGFFIKSTEVSTDNTNQKAVSFLAIADIYFEKPLYNEAQSYYDSAVSSLSSEYPGYVKIKQKSENLNYLVENLIVISHQDSLQKVAKLPASEIGVLIDGIIADLINQEKLEQELLAQQQSDLTSMEQSSRATQNEGGQWYFYNTILLSSGPTEYSKKWGSRKLEDNWRRRNKQVLDFDAIADEDAPKGDSNAVIYSEKERDFYLVELPLTDSALQESDRKMEEAYYNIATIYKDKFYDYPPSIKGYKDLLLNYPGTDYTLITYYDLYKIYVLSKDLENANIYKEKIISEFPDSDYAQILQNPEYFKELEAIDKQVNFLYQATYKYFLLSKCEDVTKNYEYVDSVYPQSKLVAKFDLLSTLCTGTTGDTVLFKENLTAFTERHPKTEESEYVLDVLAALDRSPHEVEIIEEEPVVAPSEFAEGEVLEAVDYSMFTFDANVEHVYLIVVANEKVDANRVKFNVSNFNIDYYSFLDFNIADELVSANYTAITVTKFKNKKMASNYYESVHIAGEVFDKLDKDGYRTYIISKQNLEIFKENKSIPSYHKFFELNYKGLTQK